jgi:hypothetical protein
MTCPRCAARNTKRCDTPGLRELMGATTWDCPGFENGELGYNGDMRAAMTAIKDARNHHRQRAKENR